MTETTFETIKQSIDNRGVATVTLARPEKHNAMNAVMIEELYQCLSNLADKPTVRVIVLAAEGKSFCAGADLGWMKDQAKLDRPGKIAGATKLATMLQTLDASPKVTIARVQGNAFGGGLGLISTCDLAIAVEGTKFGLTETKLGLIPATIGPFVANRLGAGFGRQVFFSGRSFNTDFAVRSGLLAEATALETLDESIETAIRDALQTAPGAVSAAKLLLRNLVGEVDQATIGTTIEALADCWESEETRAGLDAFFQRTPMPWVVTEER